ncbi:Uncharacterised protein [Achromobacter ruhlandii]|nr:Uncharacterised protein [Achromobacter ruhlandii]
MRTTPRSIRNPARLPSALRCGLPVLSVMRPALIVPQPSHTMPAGFATMTCALSPATSMKPRSTLGLLLLISLRMTRAAAPFGPKLGLPWIIPANPVEVILAELFRITPRRSTSNRR